MSVVADTEGHDEGLDAFLAMARARATSGTPLKTKVRTLVKRAGAERRGRWVVQTIQRGLDRHQLVSVPPFTAGWIDDRIELRLANSIPSPSSTPAPPSTNGPPVESMLLVRRLESATKPVISVEKTHDLKQARWLMLRHDFS